MSKLLILNKLKDKTFGKHSLVKFCLKYFKDNDWIIKYTTDDWRKYVSEVSIILFWFQQQVALNKKIEKCRILKELISYQKNNSFIILDYMEDVHQSDRFFGLSNSFYKINFSNDTNNFVIVRTENGFKKKYPTCNYFCMPFSIDSNIIPYYNNDPINKLLLSGQIHHQVYPLRLEIKKRSKQYPIDILQHPGYGVVKHSNVGEDYLKYINNYLASVATCGSHEYNYVVAKYFEIPASGALLFAYTEPVVHLLKKYGFIDGVNMISFNRKNLNDRLKYIFDPKNKEKIDEIRLNGYNLIKIRHTHQSRFYVEFHSFINSLSKMSV